MRAEQKPESPESLLLSESRLLWRLLKHRESFGRLAHLGDEIVATVRWLDAASKGIEHDYHGTLLTAKLSDDELWFWQLTIARERSEELMAAAKALGIFGEGGDPPNRIGTGRGFSVNQVVADLDRWDRARAQEGKTWRDDD